MNYIYNATKKTYQDLLDSNVAATAEGDVLRVLLLSDLDSVFNAVKRRSAIRGRFATDQKGNPLLEQIAMTDDERDWFDEIIKGGSNEITRKLASWTKGIDAACRHNVKFGNPVFSGSVVSVTNAVITDSSKAYTVDALKDKKLVITSAGPQMNQERKILSNTATTITLETAFSTPVTGMDYAICDVTSYFILNYLNMDYSWDLNLFHGIGASIEEALILYTLKEWWKITPATQADYQVEEVNYNNQLSKIRSQLLQYKIPVRRVSDFFSQN